MWRELSRIAAAVSIGGCSFAPIDHEGQLPPCVAGFVEIGGRCVRPRDGSADAEPGDCTLACEGDMLRPCGGSPAISMCAGERLLFCDRGSLVDVACPGACASGVVPSCMVEARPLDVVPSDLRDLALSSLRVPAGASATFDTMTGEILVDGARVRGPGRGLVDGIEFTAVVHDSIGVGAFLLRSLRVEGAVRVIGPAALSLVAQLEIAIEEGGTIDVSADGTTPGPGGFPGGAGRGLGGCPDADSDVLDGAGPLGGARGQGAGAGAPSGGGGGGGHRAIGGDGASADACAIGGSGGELVLPNNTLSGGGGGGAGGDPIACEGSGPNASGGAGGGALHLFALGRVVNAGVIDAGGGGGQGGGACGGGAGGGAGGAVWVDTPLLDLRAGSIIAANGGGGGGGGAFECVAEVGCEPPADATAGEDGRATTDAALGGIAADAGGGAGSDAGGMARDGEPGAHNGGGGGGGAGTLFFHTHETVELGRTSPSFASGLVTESSI
jgi:hypothetical protein